MPHLIIDNRAVTVAPGTKVIEAAECLGIMIPRFCYLKALGSVGACRMCAVTFLAGPVKGVEMSCMIEAVDGMVVSTTDRRAVDFRRQVIEWLMANHPHDCPVCDEGGHCLLQEETISAGHGLRHFPGRKRTYRDQYLGPFIQHEMNRCIHCYRCLRFYQEYAGYRDFGVMQIGSRMYYGRFEDGPLESPFSGNLVDICPTGVFTDKTARYKPRPWDLQHAPSLCLHCSLGCAITVGAANRALVSIEARVDETVNGSFICDRGRFGGFYANHPQRPWQPRVDQKELTWDEAIAATARRLKEVMERYGPGSVVALGSERGSMETQAALRHTCRRLAWRGPLPAVDQTLAQGVVKALARVGEEGRLSLAGIQEEADCLLLLGADPINEAPMLALALRQAARRGALVVVIDPRPVSLPFDFTHLAVHPGELEECLAGLIHRAIDGNMVAERAPAFMAFFDALGCAEEGAWATSGESSRLSATLAKSRRPVIVCGSGVVRSTTPAFAADLALLLKETLGWCGLCYLLAGANSYGSAILTRESAHTMEETLRAIEDGTIKAVVAAEADPFCHYPDRPRLERALARLELVIALEYLPTKLAARADCLLPTASLFEAGGHYVNHAGRVRYAWPVHGGGRPLYQVSAGSHPPRHYPPAPAVEPARHAWQLLQEITSALSPESGSPPTTDLWSFIADACPGFPHLRAFGEPSAGGIIVAQDREVHASFTAGPRKELLTQNSLELVLTDSFFGTEELSSYSGPIVRADAEPRLLIHTDEAMRLGISDGDEVILHLDQGVLEIHACLSPAMARGLVILPRHHAIQWQLLSDTSEGPRVVKIHRRL